MLADPALARTTKGRILGGLAKRPPQPGLLELVERLCDEVEPPLSMPSLRKAILAQGASVLRRARAWADDDRRELSWIGVSALAAVGEASDIPRVVAEMRGMRENDCLCPCDQLVDGLVRFGPLAAEGLTADMSKSWWADSRVWFCGHQKSWWVATDPLGVAV
jgi:hypothetical protein